MLKLMCKVVGAGTAIFGLASNLGRVHDELMEIVLSKLKKDSRQPP